jgi:hypothetical protein
VAHVALEGDHILIALRAMEKVLSLHGNMTVPLRHVSAVKTDPPDYASRQGIRLGPSIPGASQGTFITPEGKVFFSYRDARRCITLELRDERYVRIVVEIDPAEDPSRVKAEIESALRSERA